MTAETGPAALTAELPAHLRERCRVVADRPALAEGQFVLYWMHHGVRGHENPALDVTVELANRLRLPVLVYQGLGGSHRFNSDRHHTFIMQGAREAQKELQHRGIGFAFHLARTGDQSSPLTGLAARSALLVVEDFPAPPFPTWTRGLTARASAPVVAVDCSCIIPMATQPRRFNRAFEFRRVNDGEFARRIPLSWPDVGLRRGPYEGELGFEPVDLQSADLAELCSRCAIDHGVPAVAHTIGGARAGYARWKTFCGQGLSTYHRERNDAAAVWPRGVSRLSAYLHHGHVSPFRIAREAHQSGGPGAEKFLDELLIWRELAFNFCFFTPDPETLEALPAWAVATLREHAGDRRPKLLDLETLARSKSGDELWDLAQTCLRIHGELHNNLRMTWAKALLLWRPDAGAALRSLIDLNHRYALDGSDPNSYGGLLWSLGLFDRPHPEAPVIGRLRSRSTRAHAGRMNLDLYAGRVTTPSTGRAADIAVIGAGLAGLTAARTLQDQGHRVTLFEKSRGPGGRAATRRIQGLGFDHGAQYFTVRDPDFRRVVDAWRERGLVDAWRGRFGRVKEGRIETEEESNERFVGVPGMNALGKHLAEDIRLVLETRVAPPTQTRGRWQLQSETGDTLGEFELLIVALPAPQVRALLLPAAPDLAKRAEAARMAPAWAAMISLATDPCLDFDGLAFDAGPVAWAARNSSKPARQGNTWVLHAMPRWTRAHLDSDPDQVAAELAERFSERLGADGSELVVKTAHLWRYARVETPLETGSLWDPGLGLGACGDWCLGPRVEWAYLSGQAVAGRLLGHLAAAAGR